MNCSVCLINKQKSRFFSVCVSMAVLILYILDLDYYKVVIITLIIIALLVIGGKKENEKFKNVLIC